MRRPTFRPLETALAALALAHAGAFAQDAAPAAHGEPARIDSTSPACQPVYPAASLKAGAAGTTGVRFTITAAGQVTRADVVRASGPTLEHRLLDYAFEQALATCPYFPGRDWQGNAVGGTITATHVWQLPTATGH